MKNIVLTGFMGTGKSAVSAELSRLTGFSQIDVDDEIVKSAKQTIPEIFQRLGEQAFRDMETNQIMRISGGRGLIISTGGGAVLRQENMDALRANGIIICLTASPETILRRTSINQDRPLLQVPDPLGKINELMEFRRPYYDKADIIIDTEGKSPMQVAEEIIEKAKAING